MLRSASDYSSIDSAYAAYVDKSVVPIPTSVHGRYNGAIRSLSGYFKGQGASKSAVCLESYEAINLVGQTTDHF